MRQCACMRIKLNLSVVDFTVVQLVTVTLLVLLGTLAYAFSYFTGYDTVLGFLRLLDVGKEQSLPTYFSALNLLLSSILLLVLYRYEKTTNSRGSNYWLFLSVLFVCLSVDEAVSIHENFGKVQEYLSNNGLMPILETHRWVPFGILFTLLVAASLVPFMKRLPRDTALLFMAAGFVFILGAIGFELLGSWMLSTGFVESRNDLAYLLRRLAEEGLEMYGVAIFNSALYREMSKRDVSIQISA